MDVVIRNRQRKHPVDRPALERAAVLALRALGHDNVALDVTLLSDGPMRALNCEHRGVDAPTDVLSFSQLEGDQPPRAPEAPLVLGDIVLSVESAARQAGLHTAPGATPAASLQRELSYLLLHGLLHLLGRSHDEEPARDQMEAETERLWAMVQEELGL